MFLTTVSNNEIINVLKRLSRYNTIGTDGLLSEIITNNAIFIYRLLTQIYILSFSQRIFPKLLKNITVIFIFKNDSIIDPSNYGPISIVTIFSKV